MAVELAALARRRTSRSAGRQRVVELGVDRAARSRCRASRSRIVSIRDWRVLARAARGSGAAQQLVRGGHRVLEPDAVEVLQVAQARLAVRDARRAAPGRRGRPARRARGAAG